MAWHELRPKHNVGPVESSRTVERGEPHLKTVTSRRPVSIDGIVVCSRPLSQTFASICVSARFSSWKRARPGVALGEVFLVAAGNPGIAEWSCQLAPDGDAAQRQAVRLAVTTHKSLHKNKLEVLLEDLNVSTVSGCPLSQAFFGICVLARFSNQPDHDARLARAGHPAAEPDPSKTTAVRLSITVRARVPNPDRRRRLRGAA